MEASLSLFVASAAVSRDRQRRLGVLPPWAACAPLLVAALLALGGCAVSPPPLQPRVAVPALPPQPGTSLAAAESSFQATHGATASGFHLLQRNVDALRWRLVLIDSARDSLDLQYYVWFGDLSGQLLLTRVLAAANRGVRVRLLLDDLDTLLRDMSHIEVRDGVLARVARHPLIDIRVFNAWRARDLPGRVLEAAADFERLNRRMHNKQMVADGRAAIVGGRNIGDEYFGLNEAFNFHDLDVLALGPVALQASAVFDRYWNSAWVRPVPGDEVLPGDPASAEAPPRASALRAADPRLRAVQEGDGSWQAELERLPALLQPGHARVFADPPSRAPESSNRLPQAFRSLMLTAQREVLITNAYIIPDPKLLADLQTLSRRGVSVRILTNSLASHDVAAVNSHYEPWRLPLLQAGVALHELRPDAALKATLVDTPPVAGRFVGLHTKAMVVDRERSFVGSMNLDPRSEVLNAEMGMVVDSPALARSLAAAMERDMLAANSWQLRIGQDGRVRWVGHDGERARQPARSLGQRVENLFFKLFPPTLY